MKLLKISDHPVWLVGFRPFFILAFLSGMILPAYWALIFNGVLDAPTPLFIPFQWHAHEMFFGFGLAVLGGFLLTATKNWVRIRGFHGTALIFLVCCWFFERAGMFHGGDWPTPLFLISNNLFLGSLLVMLLGTLIWNRKRDSYKDNILFVLILPLLLISKYLILNPEYYRVGAIMALGIFRMAFLIMLERTLTQFMKNTFQVEILRNPALDISIKAAGVVLIFQDLLPIFISTWLPLGLALLLGIRFIFWKPLLAFKRLDLGIMYLGYLFLISQLLVDFLSRAYNIALVGTVTIHLFTFGVMGLIIPAMLIRICNGHTGRKIVFSTADKTALWIMILAVVLRIIVPQVSPAHYSMTIYAAAGCWVASFSILAWQYIPFLWQARIDGKEH